MPVNNASRKKPFFSAQINFSLNLYIIPNKQLLGVEKVKSMLVDIR